MFTNAERDFTNNCMTPQERSSLATNTIATQVSAYNMEGEQLLVMSNFLDKQTDSTGNTAVLLNVVQDTLNELNAEIDTIKADISKERRIFMDSDASVSPAVGGLYFTLVPDNKILIAFMSCMGAFLLFVSVLILLNKIPFYYFEALTYPNRIVTVAVLWSTAIIFTYLFFFAFT